ncbi:translation initiation factor eIF-1A [Candidatus Pacearchaeota archaeon]|nr:translation initiation factor eIF-1A [Candidatus Pacearchaeota archaeon]
MDNQEGESEYGDFEEIKEDEKKEPEKKEQFQQNFPVRVKLPREGQFVGVVIERLGGKRMSVKTTDKKTRNCRVPGKFSRKFWLRPGNYVIIQPWPDNDDKGDVVYQYRPNEISQLKRKGFLDNLGTEF